MQNTNYKMGENACHDICHKYRERICKSMQKRGKGYEHKTRLQKFKHINKYSDSLIKMN